MPAAHPHDEPARSSSEPGGAHRYAMTDLARAQHLADLLTDLEGAAERAHGRMRESVRSAEASLAQLVHIVEQANAVCEELAERVEGLKS